MTFKDFVEKHKPRTILRRDVGAIHEKLIVYKPCIDPTYIYIIKANKA